MQQYLLYERNKNKQAQQKLQESKTSQFLSQIFLHNSVATGLIWRWLVCSDFAMTTGNL